MSPSEKQIEDYDLAMVNAVRLSDLEALDQMCKDGKRYVLPDVDWRPVMGDLIDDLIFHLF